MRLFAALLLLAAVLTGLSLQGPDSGLAPEEGTTALSAVEAALLPAALVETAGSERTPQCHHLVCSQIPVASERTALHRAMGRPATGKPANERDRPMIDLERDPPVPRPVA